MFATEVLHEFSKNGQETVRVGYVEIDGRRLIELQSVRTVHGRSFPVPGGLKLRADLLPELETAVARLRAAVVPNITPAGEEHDNGQ